MKTVYLDALNNNLEKHSDHFSEAFAKRALIHGWPEKVVQDTRVAFQDGDMALTYDDRLSDEIMDLEYGSLNVPARAAIRNFTASVSPSIEDILIDHGINQLFNRGVFS